MYSKYSLPLLYTIITVPEYYVPKKYCKIINSRFIKFYTMCSLFCNLESLYSWQTWKRYKFHSKQVYSLCTQCSFFYVLTRPKCYNEIYVFSPCTLYLYHMYPHSTIEIPGLKTCRNVLSPCKPSTLYLQSR